MVNQSVLAGRLGRYLELSPAELGALAALDRVERTVARGAILRAEQAPDRELYAVKQGWLFSSTLLSDGSRQILFLHLPGELAGDVGLPWDKAPFSLTAATDTVVRVIEKAALRDLLARQPRIALLMYTLAQDERVALADRLASVGRTAARARIAALLSDIVRRLRKGGERPEDGMLLPLTQEEIGDATGLTAVHVNRMMRLLAEEGLIERTNGRIRVLDEERLATIANHTGRTVAIDTSWMKS